MEINQGIARVPAQAPRYGELAASQGAIQAEGGAAAHAESRAMNKFTPDEAALKIPCRVYVPSALNTILVDLEHIPEQALAIEVIAHSLATKNRYNGHTPWPYSVATHSVLVSMLIPGEGPLALEGLLHDAAEAFVGDVISPIKREIKHVFKPIEHRVDAQIRRAHCLPSYETAEIKEADIKALWLEQYLLQSKPLSDEALASLTDMDLRMAEALCSEPISWAVSRSIFLTHYEIVRKQAAS